MSAFPAVSLWRWPLLGVALVSALGVGLEPEEADGATGGARAATLTITAGPAGLTNAKDASFTFTGSTETTSFRCSLDGGAAAACTSPVGYSGLGDGGHTFVVQGFRGSVGPLVSATRAWTIDTVPPDTTITTKVPATSTTASLTLEFTAGEQASFRCRLDGAAWGACSSPASLGALSQGQHTIEVAAVDAAGNVDATPAKASWQVDSVPPDTSFITAPKPYATSATGGFRLGATEEATFRCRLDGGAYAPCDANVLLKGLAQGQHTFRAYATDSAGNSDPSPVTGTWVVDQTAPVASMVLPNAWAQKSTSFTASWKATEKHSGVDRFQVRHRFATISKPFQQRQAGGVAYTTGSWTSIVGKNFPTPQGWTRCIGVRARDRAGNVGPWTPDRCTAVPHDDQGLLLLPGVTFTAGGAGWLQKKNAPGYFLDTYVRLTQVHGCTGFWVLTPPPGCTILGIKVPRLSRAALLMTKCPSCGKLRIAGSGKPDLVLTSGSTLKQRLIELGTTGPLARTFWIYMSGEPRFDGLVVSRAPKSQVRAPTSSALASGRP